jgi:two-component system, NtrC family, sensor kinase
MTIPHSAVLYVDDDPKNVHAFRLAFKDRFRIVSASSGAEALEMIAREPVAVLVTDHRMPVMTGAELCVEVKKAFPDVIRMIVTAYSDIGAVMDAINRGEVSRYFIKPWREEQLVDALQAGIEAFQLSTLARDLQVRLLQREQQATTTYVLGRVLHEVVSPAVGIRDNLGFLLDSIGHLVSLSAAGDPEAPRLTKELLPAIQDAHAAAEDLVGRIERFRQGEPPTAAQPAGASLERAIQVAAGIARARIRERATLILDLTDKPFVRADPIQLSQIALNLLLNSCEALDPGSPEKNRITISTFAQGDHCGFVVEDTGPGFPPELRDRLFEPLVSSKSEGERRGLGLAIVRDIVENLGGKIQAEHDARGTRFYVELPRSG